MKRKLLFIITMSILLISLVGCQKEENKADALKFKEEYESLNKQEKEDGTLYRTISIDEENPIIYTTYDDLAEMINDKENFLVYFGESTNENCRLVVPYLLEQAKTQGIDKIYYVDTTSSSSEGTKALDTSYSQIASTLGTDSITDSTLAVYVNGEMLGSTTGVSTSQSTEEATSTTISDMENNFKSIYITYNSNRK